MDLFSATNLLMILLILLFVGWFIFKQIEFRVWKLPPGPIGLPLLGYGPFFTKDIHKDLVALNRKYGKLSSMNIATTRCVFVSDYDTAKELLCHPAVLARPEKMFDFAPGKGGFATMSGKQWVMERKYAMQALRNVGLGKELWDNIIQEDVQKLIDQITSRKGEPMDIRTPLSRSAMSNMLALTLGRPFLNQMTSEDFKMAHEANQIFKEKFKNFVITCMFPWLQKYLVMFNVAGSATRQKLMDEAADRFRKEIDDRVNSKVDEDATDFIVKYINDVKKQTGCEKIEDASIECLLGNIVTFVNTSDTAMLGTQWLLYFMVTYPEIQAKVHAEIDDVMGANATISWADRRKLPYTMACILEMERYVVLVPIFVPRCASETFEFHGYSIPKGTLILSNGWAFNRDPKYWNRPDEYIPERFLGKSEEKLLKCEGYAPFSFGKRNCPGEQIALTIAYLYFTAIMQKFKVATPTGEPPDLTAEYLSTLEPKNQELCFIEREQAI